MLKELTLEITRRCLNLCKFCSSMALSHADACRLSGNDLVGLLEEAFSTGVETLSISGGEPFLHPEFERIISAAASLKFPRLQIYTSGVIATNCQKSTPISEDMLDWVKKAGAILIFNVPSLDPNVHEELVGIAGHLSMAMDSINIALGLKIRVEAHIVPNRLNLSTLFNTGVGLLEMGVEKISFLRLVPQGYAHNNREVLEILDSSGLQEIFQHLREVDAGNKHFRFGIPFGGNCGKVEACTAGISKLIMRWDGKFFPCEAFKEAGKKEFELGNIYQTSFSNVFENARNNQGLKALKADSGSCDPCPAQKLWSQLQ